MDDVGLPAGVLLFLLFGLIGKAALHVSSDRSDCDFQTKLFFIAFGARFAASVVIYQFGLVNIIKDEDAGGWYVGRAFYQLWQDQGVSYLDLPLKFAESYSEHHKGYYYLVAILFYVTSLPYRLSAAAMNCFVGAWTVIIGYRTARTLFSESIAVEVGWWSCLYPSLIMWSAQTVKEPVVILLESVVIYSCVRMRNPRNVFSSLVMIAAAVVLLIPFRFYAAYMACATVVLSFLFGGMSAKADSSTKVVYLVLSAGCFLVLAFFLLSRERETELINQYSLEGIEKYRDTMAATTGDGAGSNVKIGSDLRSGGGFVTSLVVGATYLLFAPFPWQLISGSMRMLLVGPEVMLWWWLLITRVFPGVTIAVQTRLRDVMPLLVMVMGLGLLYSLTFANIGLVYRQRAQLLPWLLVFAGMGAAQMRTARSVLRQHRGNLRSV